MARFSIYSKDGSEIRYTGYPRYSGSFMNTSFIEFVSIESPQLIDWEVGDYIDYSRTGIRYKLYTLPEPKKQARRSECGNSFVYSNVKFYAATKELEIAPFRDIVPEDNEIHFSTRPEISTYEDVYGIVERIQECMDDIYPGKWSIQVFDTTDADLLALFSEQKEFVLSNGSCLDALSQIYETWKNVGWTHVYDSSSDTNTIIVGRTCLRDASNTTDAFSYGEGNGLTSIKKAAANEGEFATRLYVYGSERNIQTRYYNEQNIHNADSVDIRNLMLPISTWGTTDGLPDARKAYLQADDSIIEKYGLIPRTVYFDGTENEEIYPSITNLTMSGVRQAMIDAGEGDSEYLPGDYDYRIDEVGQLTTTLGDGSKEDTETNPTFNLSLREMGFNIAEQGKLTEEGYAIISMKSGACSGREFRVKKYSGPAYGNVQYGQRVYELENTWDESLGMGFPNTIYPIKEGDQFVILDIPMPNLYITLSENRLLEAGENLLADYTRVSAYYEPSINSINIARDGTTLMEGMYMHIVDEDIVDNEDGEDYVLIDTLNINESTELPTFRVTLRDQKRSIRTFGTLEEMIEDVKSSSRQEINRVRQYTDRRFRSAQEMLSMLQDAFENYSEGIRPITVQTMSMLVGDEGLQFKFTEGLSSLEDVPCPISYDVSADKMIADASFLVHMTLGVDSVTNEREVSDYSRWSVSAYESEVLANEGAKYVYVKASKSDSSATYVLSDAPIGMEEVSGYYHFLVGILNTEYEGERDFVTLYGFTEVLPGQITTDVLRSGNSKLIIDLANATITAKDGATIEGALKITSGSSGLSNLSEWGGIKSEIDTNIGNAQSTANEAKDVAATANAATVTLDTKITNVESGLQESIGEINERLDGVVENYFEEGTPTTSNYPVSEWKAASDSDDYELINHVGDTYTNIQEYVDDDTTPTAGQSWRWCWCDSASSGDDYVEVVDKDGNTKYLHWHPIADSDAVKALLVASEAQSTADGKSKTFVSTPTPPYKEGDLWVQGSDGVILRCKRGVNRTSGNYVANDWETASKYTDDTKAIAAQKAAEEAQTMATTAQEAADSANSKLTDWASDSVISPFEKQGVKDEYAFVVADKNDIDNQVAKYGITSASDFNSAYTAYSANLKTIIDSSEETVTIPTGMATNQSNYYAKRTAILEAIASAAKKVADDAQDAADQAQADADAAQTSANNALSMASNATSIAQSAKSTLSEWSADNVISPVEKKSLSIELAFINGDYKDIEANYQKYIQEFDTYILQDGEQYITEDGYVFNVVTANSNWESYVSAYEAYQADLENKIASSGTVAIGNLETLQSAFYDARTSILEDISLAIKAEADYSKVTAQEAIQDAADAQAKADEAYEDAQEANTLLGDIASDSKLTASEKQQTKVTWDSIVEEYDENVAEATKFGVSTTNYTSKYNTLKSYIEPLLTDLTTTSDIVGTTFRSNFSNYYGARTALLNAITTAAKALADNAQNAADDAQTTANNAQSTANSALTMASNAQSVANSASAKLSEWVADGVIAPVEKQALKNELSFIDGDYGDIYQNYVKYIQEFDRYILQDENQYITEDGYVFNIVTANSNWEAYDTAYDAYKTDLNAKISASGTVSVGTLETTQANYYAARTAILDDIALSIKAEADYSKNKAQEAYDLADRVKEFTDALNDDTILTETEKRELRRLMKEITECEGVLGTTHATIERETLTGNDWYLVDKDSMVEVQGNDVSQSEWIGFYSSNLHESQGSTVTKMTIKVIDPFSLRIEFAADTGFEWQYNYLNLSALDTSVDVTSTENDFSDNTKQASTSALSDGGVKAVKTYQFSEDGSHFIEVSFCKDGQDHQTDSGYYRVINDSWIKDGVEYVSDYKGSFHKYFLILSQNGLFSQARDLYDHLRVIMNYLNANGLWTSGDSTVASDFRETLNGYILEYFNYVANVGFDVTAAKVSDLDYLANAMKDGDTIVSGGLVMTSMVAVGDTTNISETDVEAFLNGSDFGSDADHGKLILAAGIPETSEGSSADLEERSKEAATRIYEDGTQYTNSLRLEDGCVIGDDFVISKIGTQGHIRATDYDDYDESVDDYGYVGLSKGGLSMVQRTESLSNIVLQRNASQDYAALITKGVGGFSPSIGKSIALVLGAGEDGYAIYAASGMFAGFRPNVRRITSSSSDAEKTLTAFDHTILVYAGASLTITLPDEPKIGQEYEILFTNVTASTLTGEIKSSSVMIKDSTASIVTNTFEVAMHGMVKLICIDDPLGTKYWWYYRLA